MHKKEQKKKKEKERFTKIFCSLLFPGCVVRDRHINLYSTDQSFKIPHQFFSLSSLALKKIEACVYQIYWNHKLDLTS